MNLIVTPIFLSRDREGEEREQVRSNPIDTKVRGLVLGRIGTFKQGLLSSSVVPHIALDLAMHVNSEKREGRSQREKGKRLRRVPAVRRVPIGLWAVEPEGWLNALMQFILFVPQCSELFYFAPKSFGLFREFLDRYRDDQEDQKAISSANGSSILHFLKVWISPLVLREIFHFFERILHAKWAFVERLEEMREAEFFIWNIPDGKLFLEGGAGCYELDAFIEARPDQASMHYVAYGKVAGVWYQCDDERVVSVRSNFLQIPLARATLLHYKKIVL